MIKKRNLDPSLVQWIMSQTGLGPGVGELHWVAPASSSTSQFRTQLQRWGVEQNYKIHTDPVEAEKAMVANRNDVMLLMPGTYRVADTAAAPMTWTKGHTHMIGLAGHGHLINIETITTTGVYAFKNTANTCEFHNIVFKQWGQAEAAKSCVEEHGGYNIWKNCYMMGNIRTNIKALVTASSLLCTDGGGNHDKFMGCKIGHTGGVATTGLSGVIRVDATGSLSNSKFVDCEILQQASDADGSAVLFADAASADRLLLFKDCIFYNFRVDHAGTAPSYVFRHSAGSPTTHDILLKGCARLGYTGWCNNQTFVFSADAAGNTEGGIAVAADVS